MKKISLLTTLSLLVINLCYGTTGDTSPKNMTERNQKIYELTNKELTSFLDIIPVGFEKQHGFDNREEFKKAVAGAIYTIVGVDEKWNTFSTDMFNIPVLVDNQYKAMLTVSYKDGVYSIESIGATLLAAELQQLEPVLQKDHDFIMLNVYSRQSSFVAYPSTNAAIETANYIPLESAKSSLGEITREAKAEYSLPQLIKVLSSTNVIKAN